MSLYTPKSEEQILKEGLLPAGEYDFEIVEAEQRSSQKGNPMLVVKVRVFTPEGGSRTITDYISPSSNYGEYKFRSLAMACNLAQEYESGQLEPDDFLGKTGKAQVGQQEGSNGYGPRNNIQGYLYKHLDVPLDDEIKFV